MATRSSRNYLGRISLIPSESPEGFSHTSVWPVESAGGIGPSKSASIPVHSTARKRTIRFEIKIWPDPGLPPTRPSPDYTYRTRPSSGFCVCGHITSQPQDWVPAYGACPQWDAYLGSYTFKDNIRISATEIGLFQSKSPRWVRERGAQYFGHHYFVPMAYCRVCMDEKWVEELRVWHLAKRMYDLQYPRPRVTRKLKLT